MQRKGMFLILIILSLLLTGCSLTGQNISAMLTPPAMSSGREALSQAINSAIGEGYELVYPQAGSYRTGIISVDLTGDGEKEALCFYRPNGKKEKLCFLVMENRADGWTKLAKGESEAESVGRVAFGDLSGDGLSEIVVGWQYLGDTDGSYDVYTINGGKAKSYYSGLYTRFVILDGAPQRLVVISRNTATKSVTASLVGFTNNAISLINAVPMYDRTTDFLSVLTGKTDQGRSAVYVDGQLESGQCVTEVLALNEYGRLTNELLTQLNDSTWRQTAVTCRDVNNDGILEIPVEEDLPSYYRNGLEENLHLIRWQSYNGKSLTDVAASFVDMTEKFMLDFPADWNGKVTVERGSGYDRSFVFKTYKGEELFILRTFSLGEYTDAEGLAGWQKLHSDSDHIHAVYCHPDNPMGVDYLQIYNLFHAE